MARKKKITDVVINVNTKGSDTAQKQLDELSRTLDVLHKKSQIEIGPKSAGTGITAKDLATVRMMAEEYAELARIADAPIVLQVKQRGILAQIKNLQKLQEQILDTSDYAVLISEAFDKVKDVNPFGNMEHTLEDIEASLSRLNGVMGDVESTLRGGLRDSFNQSAAAMDNAVDSTEDIVGATREGTAEFRKQGKEAAGLRKQLDQLEKKNAKLTNRMKDFNRQGTNQVRNFSSMAFAAGGLTAAYASVAATVFALSEAFRLMNEAASVDRLERVSAVISNNIGVSVRGTAKDLQEATGYAVSYQQALRQAASAAAFGFDQKTIGDFAVVAKRASVVLGVDMVDALNRVTRGVSKQEIELLDELGITVRLNEAFSEYANQLNLSADALNSYQRQQALANAVIKRSEQNLGAVDDALESTAWERFGAQVSSTTNALLRFGSTNSTVLTALDNVTQFLKAAGSAAKELDYWMNRLSGGSDGLEAYGTAATEMADTAKNTVQAANALKALYAEREKIQAQLKEASAANISNVEAIFGDAGINQNIMDILTGGGIQGLIKSNVGALKTLSKNFDFSEQEKTLEKIDQTIASIESGFKLTGDQVQKITDDAGNLLLIGRTLGTDLNTFSSTIFKGDESDLKFVSTLASTLREAEKSASNLSKNQDFSEALKTLKLTEDQWKNRTLVYELEKQLSGELGSRTSIINSNLIGMEREFALTQARSIAISQELQILKEQEATEKARLEASGDLAAIDSVTEKYAKRNLALKEELYGVTSKLRTLNLQEADLNASIGEASARNLAYSQDALTNAKAELSFAQNRLAIAISTGQAVEVRKQRELAVLAATEQVRAAEEQLYTLTVNTTRAVGSHAIALRAINDVSYNVVEQTKDQLALEQSILASMRENAAISYQTRRDQELKVESMERELQLARATKTRDDTVKAIDRGFEAQRNAQDFGAQIAEASDPNFSSNQSRMEAIALEEQILGVMQQSKMYDDDALYAQRLRIQGLQQELAIQQAQNAERMRSANEQDVISNIGNLDAGLGDTANGIFTIAEAWKTVSDTAATAGERMQASLSAAGGFVQSLQGIMSAASGAATSAIDAEIAAVKASGASQEEQEAKIKALNKKKIKEQEKYAKASILLDTAMGVAKALGSAPPPLNFVYAGLTAAAGALAYAQASNTASAQLAGLESSSSGAADTMTLTVGEASSLSTDVSTAATAGERAYTLGDSGTYGRASAGYMSAGSSYITSEGGRELITPKVDSIVQDASATEELLQGKRGRPSLDLTIVALDSRSIEERAPELLDALEEEANNRGYSIKGD